MNIENEIDSPSKGSHLAIELQTVLNCFLENHKNLSLNGLSKRCGVSEPTLRRLAKAQIKTTPSISVVLCLLSYIAKEERIDKLADLYPGAIGRFLKQNLPMTSLTQVSLEFSKKLNSALRDPTCFLIYSLAANGDGVDTTTLQQLFGLHGVNLAENLCVEQLLECKNNRFYAVIENYTLDHSHFVQQFKALADFIKPNRYSVAEPCLSPFYHTLTNGVSAEAFKKIQKIQSQALKKSAEVMFAPENKGTIPAFLLLALDTVATHTAAELTETAG
jgi:hypothetical protein